MAKPHWISRRPGDWLSQFDDEATFVVAKPFIFDGKVYKLGDVFSTTICSHRRLYSLYLARRIKMLEAKPPDPRKAIARALADAAKHETDVLARDPSGRFTPKR